MSQTKISLSGSSEPNAVELAIRARKTAKVLLPPEHRKEQQARWTEAHGVALRSMLESASWAPFHKRAHESHLTDSLSSPVPWRFHVVGPEACTTLLAFLESQSQSSEDPKWARAWQSKIKDMLCACSVLIQATWLPDPDDSASTEPEGVVSFNQKNIEHVAAASSAVQSLLIASASHQWHSYWSSGGILRDKEVFDNLGIGVNEQLLGSLFLTPEAHPQSRIIEGGLRDQRGELNDWVRWVG